MCDICIDILLYDCFYSPKQYFNCLDSIQQLLESGKFQFIGGTPIDKVKNETGHWIDDIIYHRFRCVTCGEYFTCTVNTYRGGGSFQRKNKG